MKRLFLAAVAALALTSLPAAAQTTLRASIPFEFNVGKATLPAGEYEVVAGPMRESVSVRSLDGTHSATAITYARDTVAAGRGEPTLAFYRYEDGRAYLVSIRQRYDSREIAAPAKSGPAVVALVKAATVR